MGWFPCRIIRAELLLQSWLSLQQSLWISWVVYTTLPTDANDFWIEQDQAAVMSGGKVLNIWDAYVLCESRLPSFVPVRLGEKVLFLGKAIKVRI
jgi:hypothetical protein